MRSQSISLGHATLYGDCRSTAEGWVLDGDIDKDIAAGLAGTHESITLRVDGKVIFDGRADVFLRSSPYKVYGAVVKVLRG